MKGFYFRIGSREVFLLTGDGAMLRYGRVMRDVFGKVYIRVGKLVAVL